MEKNSNTKLIRTNLQSKIESGHKLCVLGWKSSNHNDFTRSLANAGLVEFVDLSGKNKLPPLPQKAAAIFTSFLSHSNIEQLKTTNVPTHPHPLTLGVIKKILLELEPTLVEEPETKKKSAETPPSSTPTPRSLDDLESAVLTKGHTLDRFDKFVEVFAAKVAANDDGFVGARTLGDMLRELGFTEKPPALVQAGLIIAHTQEGKKKIGWYKAGPEMEKRLQKDVSEEPTNPLDKAAWLLEKEPEYQQKLDKLEVQRQYWISQLNRVKAAKELLEQMKAV